MLTRTQLPCISPSLLLNEPAARRGKASPCLKSHAEEGAIEEGAAARPRSFRPIDSPSLDIAELLGSPDSRNNSRCVSPSLGLIAQDALSAPRLVAAPSFGAPMTTASCKRASRMAVPAKPSRDAAARATACVVDAERALLAQNPRLQRLPADDNVRFKLASASTGKGPAVKADAGDAASDGAAQARMNHMSSIKSRHVDSSTQEPTWLLDTLSNCPAMYGRLVATAIKRCASQLVARVHQPTPPLLLAATP